MKGAVVLSIIIPCYNDAGTISRAVAEAYEVGTKLAGKTEIIVLNDASSDNSGEVLTGLAAKYSNLEVRSHEVNRGYGFTIRELYQRAAGKWLFSVPGDYQIGAEELTKLWPFREKAEMVLGWRVNRQDPPGRLRQSRIYNLLLRLLYGIRIHDVNSVRLMRTSVLDRIKLRSDTAFVDAELAIGLTRQKMNILEIPISHRPKEGPVGGGGNLRTILPTVMDMLMFMRSG